MLEAFLTPARTLRAPVDFSGVWNNQHGSEMTLQVNNGVVSGEYRTGVGLPSPVERFPLTGFCSDDLLVFSVNFGKYGSLTSWAGQHTIENSREIIHTLWHLARNVEDSHEPTKLWQGILSGADFFVR
jgi:hypothetical protein